MVIGIAGQIADLAAVEVCAHNARQFLYPIGNGVIF